MIEQIRKIIKPMIKPQIVSGKVLSFSDEDWTCEIELNKRFKIDKVKIKSCLNSAQSGIYIKPKIGSIVLCCLIEDRYDNMSILLFSEIEQSKTLANEIELAGNQFNGLVKLQELEQNLNKIKTAFDTLKTAISSGLNAVGAGSEADGTTGASTFNSAATLDLEFANMENEKVKHG